MATAASGHVIGIAIAGQIMSCLVLFLITLN